MTIHKGFLSKVTHVVVFCMLSWTMVLFHVYKQLTTQKNHKKAPSDDGNKQKVVANTGCDRGFGRLLGQELGHCLHKKTASGCIDAHPRSRRRTQSSPQRWKQPRGNSVRCYVGWQCEEHEGPSPSNVVGTPAQDAVLFGIVNNAGIANPGDFIFSST